jgi:hypothetical protein
MSDSPLRNILVTGIPPEGENVMVFTSLAADTLQSALRILSFEFEDCYEVREDEVQFYCFDPLWLSPAQETRCRSLAA